MTIYFLLTCLIIVFLLSYFCSGEDILAPEVIICIMWTFSVLCAIYNIDYWRIDIHWNTIDTIVTGILSFIFGGLFGKYLSQYNFKLSKKLNIVSHNNKIKCSIQKINVWYPIVYILIIIDVVTVIWQYRWLMSVVGSFNNWTNMMNDFRINSSSWSIDAIQKSSFLSNLEILLATTSYMLTYIGINNIIAEKKIFKNIILFVPSLLYVLDLLLNAGRGNILLLIGAILIMVYIVNQKNKNWQARFSRKYIKVMIISLVLVSVFFSFSRSIVGRIDDSGIVDYITTYAGGSVQLFDMYLQDPIIDNGEIFGKETFGLLINLLGKWLNIDSWIYLHHSEFRVSNGVIIGNVYGAFRPYIHDFGFIGVIILSFIEGLFYSLFYAKIKNNKKPYIDGFDWSMYMYIYFARGLFMYSMASYTFALFGNFIALIKWILFSWILKRMIVNRSFSNK